MIFISGPVLVPPKTVFKFQACLSDQASNGKWWKIKDGTTEEIKIDDKKYFTYYKGNICEIEIHNAEEKDSATYQFSLNNIKSNKIYTLVDGKYSKLLIDIQLTKEWTLDIFSNIKHLIH